MNRAKIHTPREYNGAKCISREIERNLLLVICTVFSVSRGWLTINAMMFLFNNNWIRCVAHKPKWHIIYLFLWICLTDIKWCARIHVCSFHMNRILFQRRQQQQLANDSAAWIEEEWFSANFHLTQTISKTK